MRPYRLVGYIFVLVAMALIVAQMRAPGPGLYVLSLIFGMLGVCVIVGTAVAKEGEV